VPVLVPCGSIVKPGDEPVMTWELPCPATNPADHRYSLVDPTVMETRVAQLIVAELPTISLA
jgi:hypothetical protein